jgi:hypothetical protein
MEAKESSRQARQRRKEAGLFLRENLVEQVNHHAGIFQLPFSSFLFLASFF